MIKILLLDKVALEGAEILKQEGSFEVIQKDHLNDQEKLEIIEEYQAVVIRSATQFTRQYFDRAKKLKLIVRGGEGTDNIDKNYAAQKGVIVENTPGQNSHAVAELTIAHMFSLARHLPEADQTMHEAKWEKKKYKGIELKGKTIGIVGIGNIGKIVARTCAALGMKVLVSRKNKQQHDISFPVVDLDQLLEQSDFVSIHIPFNNSTRGLINQEKISKMKKSAFLINCARGAIIDEQALANAVKNGQIKGAAIDVFSREPIEANNPLLNIPNIHLTPHIAASTEEAQVNCAIAAAQQIIAFFKQNKVINQVK